MKWLVGLTLLLSHELIAKDRFWFNYRQQVFEAEFSQLEQGLQWLQQNQYAEAISALQQSYAATRAQKAQYYRQYALVRSGADQELQPNMAVKPIHQSPPAERPVISIYGVKNPDSSFAREIYHQLELALAPSAQLISTADQQLVIKNEQLSRFGFYRNHDRNNDSKLSSKRQRSDHLLKSRQFRLYIQLSDETVVGQEFSVEVYVAVLDLVAQKTLAARAFYHRGDSPQWLSRALAKDIADYGLQIAGGLK